MKNPGRLKKLAVFLVLLLVAITFLPVLRFRRLANRNPLPSAFSKGVFHVHTTFSDGKGGLEEVTAAAAEADLDFLVICDHGTPNRDAASATRWVNGVLVVGGSELDLKGLHLGAAGFSPPNHPYPPEPQESIDEVKRDGGVSFIAHPFFPGNPWTEWNVEDHTGIELINAHTSLSRPQLAKLVFVPRYLARPTFALLTALDYPAAEVDVWEEMNRDGRYSGIFGLDAHARTSVGFGHYVNLPTYPQMFALLNVYVDNGGTLDEDAETAAATLIDSLRKGSFFNCIEAIAPGNGFDAVFETDTGERLEMGGVSPHHSGRFLMSLPFDFATDVVVFRDGETYREFTNHREPSLTVEVTDRGVYRIEVFARASTLDHLPWIMTNPFYLGTPTTKEALPIRAARKMLADGPGFFRVECDPTSECSKIETETDLGLPVVELRYALPEAPSTRNFAAALANRRRRTFAGFDGLMLDARSDRRARYWLMFRTESGGAETWYRYSFSADSEWSTVAVPFEKFRVHHGEVRPPDLEAVTSLFISIDNQIAYPGSSGSISVKGLALF